METIPRQGYRFIAPLTYPEKAAPAVVSLAERESVAPAVPIAGRQKVRWRGWAVAAAAILAIVAIGTTVWLWRTGAFWENPIAGARFETITEFDGVEGSAAISRDGHFVAFLSDRDGQTDVWVTQTGSGQFHNLTRGSAGDLANPSLRTMGFSSDGSLVTYWVRKPDGSIGIWAVPTLGGEPRPYLEGTAEFDWSRLAGRNSGWPLHHSRVVKSAHHVAWFSMARRLTCPAHGRPVHHYA